MVDEEETPTGDVAEEWLMTRSWEENGPPEPLAKEDQIKILYDSCGQIFVLANEHINYGKVRTGEYTVPEENKYGIGAIAWDKDDQVTGLVYNPRDQGLDIKFHGRVIKEVTIHELDNQGAASLIERIQSAYHDVDFSQTFPAYSIALTLDETEETEHFEVTPSFFITANLKGLAIVYDPADIKKARFGFVEEGQFEFLDTLLGTAKDKLEAVAKDKIT